MLIELYCEHQRLCFFQVAGKCAADGGFDVLGTIIESLTRYLRFGPSHIDVELHTSSLQFGQRHVGHVSR